MNETLSIEHVLVPSKDIVAREIEGEILIIPFIAGIAEVDDVLYSLNPMGKMIWHLLDGKRSLKDIALELSKDYDATLAEIEEDILGLANELYDRSMLVQSK